MPAQTRKRKAAMATTSQDPEEPSLTSAATPKRQKNLPVRPKDEAAGEEQSRGNVVTFDDEGNADKELIVPSTMAAPARYEPGSDSDEAPEAVSTAKIATEMIGSAQAARKVAQERAVAEKKKRQQRDALFKQQASERKGASADAVDIASSFTIGRGRAERTDIPDLLPAEFLTDSSSDEEDASLGGASVVRRKRNVLSVEKRLSRQGRGPRDAVIGNTVYRVTRNVDTRMAPKVKKYAKSSRDALLKRGREPVKSRRSTFFKK